MKLKTGYRLLAPITLCLPLTGCVSGLHGAAMRGNLSEINGLLDRGEEINEPYMPLFIQYYASQTPLHLAAQFNRIDAVKLLIKRGANVNVETHNQLVPLCWAIKNGRFDIAQILIDAGANLNGSCNEDRMTPLHAAAMKGWSEAAKYLLQKGANVDAPERHGWTPLTYAVGNGQSNMVRILLDAEADPQKQRGLLKVAEHYHYTDIVEMLRKYYEQPARTTNEKATPK